MKTISNCCFVLLAWVLPVIAQSESPPVGFVRIIHAVAPGEGHLQVTLDGATLRPRGYELGQRTGGIGLPEGDHAIELSKTGVGTLRETVAVSKGQTITLLAYGKMLPAKREGQPPSWAIKLRKLPAASADRGFHLHLISLCDREELVVRTMIEAKRKTEITPLKRFETADLDLGRGRGGVELRLGDEVLAAVSLEDPGRYVVVLYEDASGRVRALAFYDPKFDVAG